MGIAACVVEERDEGIEYVCIFINHMGALT